MCNWLTLQVQHGSFNGEQVVGPAMLGETRRSLIPVAVPRMTNGFLTNYGMGWFIMAYRGEEVIQHGGNIDGFFAMVAFAPKDAVGVVILTNLNGNPVPELLRNTIMDRLLELEPKDWNAEAVAQWDQAKLMQDSLQQVQADNRVAGTQPSQDLSAYTGTYEDPGYGTIIISALGSDSLRIQYNSFDARAGHFHYDVFKGTDPEQGANFLIQFQTDIQGRIQSLSAQLEPAVEPIVFQRKVEVELSAALIDAYTGKYSLMGQIVTIAAKDDKTLTMEVPGQPMYELEPIAEHSFQLKGIPGYEAQFLPEKEQMIMKQPNGTFTLDKKE